MTEHDSFSLNEMNGQLLLQWFAVPSWFGHRLARILL